MGYTYSLKFMDRGGKPIPIGKTYTSLEKAAAAGIRYFEKQSSVLKDTISAIIVYRDDKEFGTITQGNWNYVMRVRIYNASWILNKNGTVKKF